MTIKTLFRLFALFTLLLAAQPGNAQVVVGEVKPLDKKVSLTSKQYDEVSRLIQEMPLGDRFLAYRIKLPKDWIQVRSEGEAQTELNTKLLGDLAKYVSPPNPDIRSTFRIRATQMTYDMSTENWMLNYILSNGYALEGLTVVSDKRVEAQYVVLHNASANVVRAVAELSGPRIVLAEYSVPSEIMNQEERNKQIWSMVTFRLSNPDPAPVEKLETFSFLDISKFNFPKSWILNAPTIQSVERIEAAIINLRGRGDATLLESGEKPKLDGRIDVSLVAKTLDSPIPLEIKKIRKDIELKNLFLGPVLETKKDWKVDPNVLNSWIEVYPVNGKEGKSAGYEMWVAIVELPEQHYYVRLLTLSREDDFFIWARNIKAFETVVETLRPHIED